MSESTFKKQQAPEPSAGAAAAERLVATKEEEEGEEGEEPQCSGRKLTFNMLNRANKIFHFPRDCLLWSRLKHIIL